MCEGGCCVSRCRRPPCAPSARSPRPEASGTPQRARREAQPVRRLPPRPGDVVRPPEVGGAQLEQASQRRDDVPRGHEHDPVAADQMAVPVGDLDDLVQLVRCDVDLGRAGEVPDLIESASPVRVVSHVEARAGQVRARHELGPGDEDDPALGENRDVERHRSPTGRRVEAAK